jgi:hypothetical protein
MCYIYCAKAGDKTEQKRDITIGLIDPDAWENSFCETPRSGCNIGQNAAIRMNAGHMTTLNKSSGASLFRYGT